MQKNHAIDKSGEDRTECDMCGFHNGGHMADCPLAKPTEHKRMTDADHRQNALTLAYLKATDRRFTGAALTGFGAL